MRRKPTWKDVAKGGNGALRALETLVDAEGAAAAGPLESVIERAKGPVLRGAFLELAQLDSSRAEALALERSGEDTRALFWVATPACLERLQSLRVKITPSKVPLEARARGLEWVLEALEQQDPQAQAQTFQDWNGAASVTPSLARTLEVPGLGEPLRRLVFAEAMARARVAPDDVLLGVLRRDDVPAELEVAARFLLPPTEAFERLRHTTVGPAEFAAQPHLDERWLGVLAAIGDQRRRRLCLLATRLPGAVALLADELLALASRLDRLSALSALDAFTDAAAKRLANELRDAEARTQLEHVDERARQLRTLKTHAATTRALFNSRSVEPGRARTIELPAELLKKATTLAKRHDAPLAWVLQIAVRRATPWSFPRTALAAVPLSQPTTVELVVSPGLEESLAQSRLFRADGSVASFEELVRVAVSVGLDDFTAR